MKKILRHRFLYLTLALIIVMGVIFMIGSINKGKNQDFITATVDIGTVQQIVSVSGIAEAEQMAELAFPTTGIIKNVNVIKGQIVAEGDIIAELDTRALYADRQDALSAVQKAIADRDELIAGPSGSARNLTAETIQSKKEALLATKADEAQKVSNAYTKLLSSDLTAYSNDSNENAVTPLISGTYNCDQEGNYIIDIFSSGSNSGYSFKLSGLETGTYVASTEQPTALGNCGLRIIFDSSSNYDRSQWIVEIPNTKANSYITNRNAYALAVTLADSAITQAEQALKLAEASADDQNSPARSEAVIRANAAIEQTRARLARIDANINDRILRAPFAGTITNIDILPGETVTTAPIVTLLASSDFEVTAKIPEIDIGKLSAGQKVNMLFDARSNENLTGEISFISLKETIIDGVSYYEAIIQFDNIPDWMRSGLNADIDIVIAEDSNTLRVPTRFVSTADNNHTIQVLDKAKMTYATSTVEVKMFGNDGYVSISGLEAGTTVVAP